MKNKLLYLSLIGLQSIGSLAQAGPVTSGTDYVYDGKTFKDFSYDFQDNGDLQLTGRVYFPSDYDPADTTKKYPLIVFYHGNGLGGGDNTTQVVSAGELGTLRAAVETYKMILYLPQTIPVNNGWYQPGGAYLDMSMLQIANLQSAYKINRDQLYLTGFSMGGNATWSMGGIHAGAVAALIPVDPNSGGMADSNAAQLLTKGVWGFCNGDDTTGVKTQLRYRMNGLRVLDGKSAWTYPTTTGTTNLAEDMLRYTEPAVGSPSGHHAKWAYGTPELFPWMLAQKNTTGWMRTGEKICFDFGNQQVATTTGTDNGLSSPSAVQTYTRPDSAGTAWNSTASGYSSNFGAAIPFAKTTAGRSTLASLYVVDKFTDYYRSAATQTLYDANIGLDGWMSPVSGTGTIQIQGLTPNGTYKVEIFATTEQTGGAYTTSAYKIGSSVQTLTVLGNQATKATFASVSAGTSGVITLSVSGTSGSTYGLIGTLELTALNAGTVAAPEIMSVVSRKTQGSGTWDIPLYDNWRSLPGVEPRQGAVIGSNQWVFTFNQPVTEAAMYISNGSGTLGAVSFAGNQMTVNFTGVADNQYLSLAMYSVKGIGSTLSGTASFGVLCGDVNSSLAVDATDQSLVTAASGQTVVAQNFVNDVNCDGAINSTDSTLVGAKLNNVLVEQEDDSVDITAQGTAFGTINPPTGGGSKQISTICNGIFPAIGGTAATSQYDTFSSVTPRIPVQCYGYTFTENKVFNSVVFQEGIHFTDGGWWANGAPKIQVRQNGSWVDVSASLNPAYPVGNTKATFGQSFETYVFRFDPVVGDGIQITGTVGGTAQFTSIGELRIGGGSLPVDPENLARTSGSAFGTINPPTGGGSKQISTICNGIFPVLGGTAATSQYDTYTNVLPRIPVQAYGYTFTENKFFTSVVYQEGMHFTDGGWWADGSLKVQVRQNGVWVDVPVSPTPAYPVGNTKATFGLNFETYTFDFPSPVMGDGIQITGTVGGTAQFTSIGELEAWGF